MHILLLIIIFIIGTNGSNIPVRDVCIVGGGSSGMSMAVLTKDIGYDPIVFERQSTIGGHCDTINFTPPPGKTDNWIDIGVQAFINTTLLNVLGYGNWIANTETFIKRFAGNDSLIPINTNTISKFVDMQRGFEVTPSFNATAFQIALGNYYAILAQYPWTDLAQYPQTIPSELLIPFGEFAALHGLEPLAPLIRVFGYGSGLDLGNYSNVMALYMLVGMSRTTLNVAIGGPTAAYSVKGGCQQIYNGMRDYLGTQNILTNAQVTSIKRRNNDRPSQIKGTINGIPFKYKCKKVIAAFSPQLNDIQFMNPDSLETSLFKHAKYFYYYTGTAITEGPLAVNTSYQVGNSDLINSQFQVPFVPSVTNVGRVLTYGPSQIQATSDVQKSVTEMRAIVQEQLDRIPPNIFTNVDVDIFFQHGGYWGYFDNKSLRKNYSPWAKLNDLQGHRNTFWVGALNRMASSSHIWDDSYRIIAQYFPPKN